MPHNAEGGPDPGTCSRAGGTKVTDWRPIGDRFERSSWRHSVPPEVFEPGLTQCRVARGVGDRDVPEPVLDRAGVDAVIGELVTAAMPEPRRLGLLTSTPPPRCSPRLSWFDPLGPRADIRIGSRLMAGDAAEEYWRGPMMKRAKRRSSRTTVHHNGRAQKCAVHNGPAEVSYDQPKAAEPPRGQISGRQ